MASRRDRGPAFLAAILAVRAVAIGAEDSSRESLALFHKMQAALGGAEKIAAIRDFEQQVRAVAVNGNTGQRMGEVVKRTRWIRPNILRIDQVSHCDPIPSEHNILLTHETL